MHNDTLILNTIADMASLISQLGEAHTVMADVLEKTREISVSDRHRLQATRES